jgi:hypothetical protein
MSDATGDERPDARQFDGSERWYRPPYRHDHSGEAAADELRQTIDDEGATAK